jgi:hypothetical protein
MYKHSFITGIKHRTCCFYCGLVLTAWASSDSVWVVHIKYNGICLYVLHLKGVQFVMNNSKTF